MAWKGRSDLEKEMRKANDRLRALEAHGYTEVPAYREALRLTRIASGDPNARIPRFRRSDYKGNEKELRRALKKFNAPVIEIGPDGKKKGYTTSTVSGVKKMIQKQIKAYQQTADSREGTSGTKITEDEAKKIGNIWEGIRKSAPKYDASRDTEIQYLIEKGLQNDRDQHQLTSLLEHLRESNIPSDDWEKAFDVVWDRWDDGDSMTDILIDIDEALYVSDIYPPEDIDEE